MGARLLHCKLHSKEVAAWRCTECDRALCPDCAAPDVLGKLKIARCVHCNGLGEPIRYVPEIVPFQRMIGPYLRVLKTPDALMQFAALSIVLGLASLAFGLGTLISGGLVTAYYLLVVNHAAEGLNGLPDAGSEENAGIVNGVMKTLVASWWLWFPFLFWLGHQGTMLDAMDGELFPFKNPISLILLILTVWLAPATIMCAATGGSLVEIVNPLNSLRIVASSPGGYLLSAGIWSLTVVADRLLAIPLAAIYDALPIIVIVPAITGFIGLFIPVFSALMLGRLMYQHGVALGIYTHEDLIREQVPDAEPRAALDVAKRHRPDEDPLPVDLELVEHNAHTAEPSPPVFAAYDPVGPIDADLPVDEDVAIELSDAPPQTLEEVLEAGDDEASLRRFREMRDSVGVEFIPAHVNIELARVMERQRDIKGAAKAWQRAARDLSGPHAPDAVYGLALLMIDRLRKPEQGSTLLKTLIQKFPDHPTAAEAATRLAGLETAPTSAGE